MLFTPCLLLYQLYMTILKLLKTTFRWSKLTCCSLLVCSCDLFDYHPYDTKMDGAHDINAHNIEQIEKQCAGHKTIRFVQISDTQRWYDETRDAVRSINARDDIDFVVHCGDVSDFGVTSEFEVQRDILQKLDVPYVVLLGNHDCLGTGPDVYRYIFGKPDFTFDAGDTHFVCLNTNAYEYDYSTPIPDFTFIQKDQDNLKSDIKRTVIAMHAQPFSDQFNNNTAKAFEYSINKYPGLAFCICGHGHSMQVNDLFGDGILYYECSAAKNRKYVIFTLKEDGSYDTEEVQY